jgi:prepilin-type N-terminal cleavage/methylation domain-containing protein
MCGGMSVFIGKWAEHKCNDHHGHTLLELIIAVVVLVVLIMVAIPLYQDTIDTAKMTADEASLVILNKATQELKLRQGGEAQSKDIFTMYEDCGEALNYLVQEGFLQSAPKPTGTGRCFSWNRAEQKWEIGFTDGWDLGEIQPSKE